MIDHCPHCGGTLAPDEAVKYGRWKLSPDGAELDGNWLQLTTAESRVLYTLARARGKVVPAATIGRQFTKSSNYQNSLRVIVARLRKKVGKDCPIVTVQGSGYRWQSANHD